MESMETPVTGTERQFSSVATAVSRFCHSPFRWVWTVGASILLCIYNHWSLSALPIPSEQTKLLGTVETILAVVLLLAGLIGPLFLPLIYRKSNLGKRVALWDIGGRKSSWKMRLLIALLIIVLLFPSATVVGFYGVRMSRDVIYSRTMSVLQTDPDAVPVAGNRAVTYENGRFSKRYLPQVFQTEAPEQVRYILRCTDGEKVYGLYSVNGITGYQYWRTVELVDRESNQVLSSATFFGSAPPNRVFKDTKKDQYGSKPSEQEIGAWVANVLPVKEP